MLACGKMHFGHYFSIFLMQIFPVYFQLRKLRDIGCGEEGGLFYGALASDLENDGKFQCLCPILL